MLIISIKIKHKKAINQEIIKPALLSLSLFFKFILEKFDFWVEIKDDLVFAWLEGHKENYLEDRLKILGHLVMHTRQLDMVLSNKARMNWYVEETLKQIASFVNISLEPFAP
ncbi:MAG: hypothetical protein HQ573_03695 [Desulfobacteraceae bacterium]|nr:hypothetical protein [Desulfobacteraceae bacterium]